MIIKIVDNMADIRESFVKRFVMPWEEFQIQHKDWMAKKAKSRNPITKNRYEQFAMWGRMSLNFPRVSMMEALACLREHSGTVLFMPDKGDIVYCRGEKIVNFIAEADAHALAAQIEQEWYNSFRAEGQNTFDAGAFLPDDLYVFDLSMKWCVVFTHETIGEVSEIDNPMRAMENRYCIVCAV